MIIYKGHSWKAGPILKTLSEDPYVAKWLCISNWSEHVC